MANDLDGKAAIITGAGQGIGRVIAQRFAAQGARVVVATRTESHGLQTVQEILAAGGNASLIQTDVGVPEQVKRLVDETVERYGQLDIVLHNAGIYATYKIEEVPCDVLEETLTVNLKACFYLTQAAVPYLRRRGGGRILVTSSVTGPKVAMVGTAHYAASKGGVNAFIRSAALEYAREKITVNGVEPGYILTPGLAEACDDARLAAMATHIPMQELGMPEDVANAMVFLASDEARYITGQTLVVDGGSILPESPTYLDRF